MTASSAKFQSDLIFKSIFRSSGIVLTTLAVIVIAMTSSTFAETEPTPLSSLSSESESECASYLDKLNLKQLRLQGDEALAQFLDYKLNNNLEARNKLVGSFLAWMRRNIRTRTSNATHRDELFQLGATGLIMALDSAKLELVLDPNLPWDDPRQIPRLVGSLRKAVNWGIIHGIREQKNVVRIRLPKGISYKRIIDPDADLKEMSQGTSWSESQLKEAQTYLLYGHQRLDVAVNEDGEERIFNLMDPEAHLKISTNPEKQQKKDLMAEFFAYAEVAIKRERQRQMFSYIMEQISHSRAGKEFDIRSPGLDEIGRRFGYSKERARQIRNDTLVTLSKLWITFARERKLPERPDFFFDE